MDDVAPAGDAFAQPDYARLLGYALLLPLIEWVDIATGYAVDTSIFYLVPICLATWQFTPAWGAVFALMSGVAWAVSAMHHQSGVAPSLHPSVVVYNDAARVLVSLMIVLMLSRLKDALRREQEQSRTDPLTGAMNLRCFHERAAVEFARSRRQGHALTLAYLDLDNFKSVNDCHGHAEGNRLLRCLAETAQANLRSMDLFARLGGDEFALLLPETDAAAARPALARLQQAIQSALEGEAWPVTLSVGAVSYDAPPKEVKQAVTRADNVMYEAKRAGKNRLELVEEAAAPQENASG